jgi:hypothetical protein
VNPFSLSLPSPSSSSLTMATSLFVWGVWSVNLQEGKNGVMAGSRDWGLGTGDWGLADADG